MPKLKTNKAAKKRYSLTATGKVKRTKSNRRHLLANKKQNQTEDIYLQTKQVDKKNQEKFKMLMQIKHVKTQSKNYYLMVIN